MDYKKIKNKINKLKIVNIIGKFIKLKKCGKNFKGFSPFNKEKNPSFFVSPYKNIWKDFSSGKGGNLITFFIEYLKFDYLESIKFIFNKFCNKKKEIININFLNTKNNFFYNIYNILNSSSKFFIKKIKENKNLLNYLIKRNINIKNIKKFSIGYAPENYNLINFLKNEKIFLEKKILKETGLFIIKKKNIYNLFRNRIIFPIKNIFGKIIGFGGRTLNNNYNKYINTPNNKIYKKSENLYGLYESKNYIIKNKFCYLVEGYIDVISLHNYGIKNVLSSLGTFITQKQINLIKKFTNNIILLYDGDISGVNAAIKNINFFLKNNINIRFFIFPKNQDPNSFLLYFIKKKKKKNLNFYFQKKSLNFLDFKIKKFKNYFKDPYKKYVLIKNLERNILNIKNPIIKELFYQEIIKIFKINIKLLNNNNIFFLDTKKKYIENQNYNFKKKIYKKLRLKKIIKIYEKNILNLFKKYKKYINEEIILIFNKKQIKINMKKVFIQIFKIIDKNKIFLKKKKIIKKIKKLIKKKNKKKINIFNIYKKISNKIILNYFKEKLFKLKYYLILKKINFFLFFLKNKNLKFKKKIKILNKLFFLTKIK
ncbi:MAG: DNA primase, partial [Candidatus Shikimatogenerans sp. JK-2022]|nr:DNA primase [Candidatus Shikimatogenerans bostrichidophilus]